MRRPKFWTAYKHQERLSCRSQREAVEVFLDDQDPAVKTPEVLTLYGYAPIDVAGLMSAQRIAEDALERLDEEYGDPDGEITEPTERILSAARELEAAIVADYEPWACELVAEETVNVVAVLAREEKSC